jgi:hypothetical protein
MEFNSLTRSIILINSENKDENYYFITSYNMYEL